MNLRISPRRVGSIVTSFGIQHRRRINSGWLVLLDRSNQVTIHELVERHGLDAIKNNYLNFFARQTASSATRQLRSGSDLPNFGARNQHFKEASEPHPRAAGETS